MVETLDDNMLDGIRRNVNDPNSETALVNSDPDLPASSLSFFFPSYLSNLTLISL